MEAQRKPKPSKTVGTSKSTIKTSKTERKKKFNKWFSMRQYNHDRGHTPGYSIDGVPDPNKHWNAEDERRCLKCNGITGEMFKKEDGNWYCYYHEEDYGKTIETHNSIRGE